MGLDVAARLYLSGGKTAPASSRRPGRGLQKAGQDYFTQRSKPSLSPKLPPLGMKTWS